MFDYIKDLKLQFSNSLTKRKTTTMIVLHHTAGPDTQTVQQIHSYHKNTKGWAGIGYNIIVDKDGNAYWGRGLEYVGAHCQGHNSKSIGICAIGNFMEKEMPQAQKDTVKKIIVDLKKYYSSIEKIVGHKELAATSCPGDNYPLQEIKNAFAIDSNKTVDISNYSMIQYGSRGQYVKKLQKMLNTKGTSPKLVVDGIFGNKTEKAVIGFQRKERIAVDGIVGPITWGRLEA